MSVTKQKRIYPIHKRVFVGMSGGVDSSVSVALLKKAGYEVIGVFIRVWEPTGFVCNWREERRWARRVAAHLDIPLLTLDLSREYKKRVVDYFISEYKAGRTPNPDVMCNKHIKFGIFYDWAIQNGADFVATGHYTQIQKLQAGSYKLLAGRDKNKDQSYFLWNIRQDQLSHVLFPVGKYTKPQVRTLAKKFSLPTAEKKDSQGLCFVGKIDFKDFLKHEIKEKKGAVLDEQGRIIGSHDGATFFTLGERHGFEITTKSPSELPYYVVAKDVKKNTLTVSDKPYSIRAERLEVQLEKTNWISDPFKLPALNAQAGKSYQLESRVRYRQPLQKCQIKNIDNKKGEIQIIFEKPQLAVPGQSLVLYDKDVCLGGGVID